MPAEIRIVPCLKDNYAYLVHCGATGATAAVDVPEAGPVRAALAEAGWSLTHILITHHHGDHTAGLAELKAATGAVVLGPAGEAGRIAGLDRLMSEGDRFEIGALGGRVIETPGHTAGHIVYHLDQAAEAFVGDTLFVMGCGRVIEGTMAQMWGSLLKLRALPPETRVWCGHEYTLANARFARGVDPDNAALAARLAAAEAQRGRGEPTVPSTIGEEIATNPFLRADELAVARAIGLVDADPLAVFTELRERKNRA